MDWRLVRDITLAQMKARYRRTVSGFVWVVLNPLMMYATQSVIFRYVLKIPAPNYGLFLLGGLLPWIFLVSSLDSGIPVLVNSREMLSTTAISPSVLVLSALLDNAVNFFFAFLLVLLPSLFFFHVNLKGLLLLPLAIATLALGTGSLLWLLSVLNVFYRDVRFVVQFAVSVLFFLTPIFYPLELIPAGLRSWVGLNPAYVLILPVRECIYYFSPHEFCLSWLRAAGVAVILFALSLYYWRLRKNEFFHYV